MKENDPIQPHIGEMIKIHLDKRRARKSALARVLDIHPSTILHYQKKPSLQLGIIWKLSTALEYNFFADLAAMLPAEYGTEAPKDPGKDEQISTLERRIEILEAEKNMLMQILEKKSQA